MTELLAPAGNTESFLAALSAGADAVYLGGKQFGARAFAENFSQEELLSALKTAHLHRRKVYMTVNTLIREQELESLPAFLKPFYEEGLDGVIIADPGAITLIHEVFPDLPLHASTQMTLTGPLSEPYLARCGITRVVPARELSLKEIADWKQQGSLELEIFIHGAMCYCYSGQCLLSSMLGKRSGNRGRCGGACRLPYHTVAGARVLNKESELYQLSLKDLCGLEALEALMRLEIDSFKIEGRMKSPAYVYTITALYRKYMDLIAEGKSPEITAEDQALLASRFNRGGLSGGYFAKHNGRELVLLTRSGYLGSSSEDAALKPAENAKAIIDKNTENGKSGNDETAEAGSASGIPALARIPVSGSLYLQEGMPTQFSLKAGSDSAFFEGKAQGDPCEKAQNRPTTAEEMIDRLGKLGNTPFAATQIRLFYKGAGEKEFTPYDDTAAPLFIGVKALNDLRRSAASALEDQLLRATRREAVSAEERDVGKPAAKNLFPRQKEARTKEREQAQTFVSLRTIEQLRAIPQECYEKIDALLLSYDLLRVKALHPAIEKVLSMIREVNGSLAVYCMLPAVTRRSVIRELSAFTAGNAPAKDGFVVGSLEAAALLHEKGCSGLISAPSLPVFSKSSAAFYEQLGIRRHILSYELTQQEMTGIVKDAQEDKHAFILPVYGYIPVMVSAGCVRTTNRECLMEYPTAAKREKATAEPVYLVDRMQKKLPVVLHCDRCENTIYNTVPLSLHKDMDKVTALAPSGLLYSLTVEDGKASEAVLRCFLLDTPAKSRFAPRDFTRGHFLKGVE